MKRSKEAATLLTAVGRNDLKQLRELIKAGADVHESEEYTPLAKAAQLGHADLVKELLKAGADANSGGMHVPLCAAVNGGHSDIMALLLKAGTEVDAQEEAGESALMFAAAKGDLKATKQLLKAGADPKLQDEDGESAIIYGKRWPRVIELLKPLSAPDDVEYLERESVKIATTVKSLLAAARTGDVKKVQKLLDGGAPVDGADKDGETALRIAVEKENVGLLELLIKAGANVDLPDNYGRTPLWEAAGCGNIALMERLIKAGADINAREKLEGKTPFLNSIGPKQKARDSMRWLAKNGADIKAVDNYDRTALTLSERYIGENEFAEEAELRDGAALRELLTELGLIHNDALNFTTAAGDGDLQAVEKMLSAGLSPDTVDDQERTALYMAVSRQQTETVCRLLKAGADVHKAIGRDEQQDVQWGGIACSCPDCGTYFVSMIRDRQCPKCGKKFNAQKQFGPKLDGQLFFTWSNGYLPLMVAARVNHPEIISLLIGVGADVNRGKDGLSPLMVAAYFGHFEAARELLKHGAKADHQTKTPDRLREIISPIILAARGKHLELIKLLWESGVPAKDKKPTLLVAAAARGDTKEIKHLIDTGADPNAQDPLTLEWPLSIAAHAGQGAAVDKLISAGASAISAARQVAPLLAAVSALEYKQRQDQATPAVIKQYVTVAKSLVAAGAKPTTMTFGVSPLSMAEEMKISDLVEVLKSAATEIKTKRK